MAEKQLTKEFRYFVEHQDELVAQYQGKVLAIKDDGIVGVFDDELTALRTVSQKYEPGTFMVQRCEPGPECYTVMFHGYHVAVHPC